MFVLRTVRRRRRGQGQVPMVVGGEVRGAVDGGQEQHAQQTGEQDSRPEPDPAGPARRVRAEHRSSERQSRPSRGDGRRHGRVRAQAAGLQCHKPRRNRHIAVLWINLRSMRRTGRRRELRHAYTRRTTCDLKPSEEAPADCPVPLEDVRTSHSASAGSGSAAARDGAPDRRAPSTSAWSSPAEQPTPDAAAGPPASIEETEATRTASVSSPCADEEEQHTPNRPSRSRAASPAGTSRRTFERADRPPERDQAVITP
ncbi:hypothetical protein JYK04_01697 [Streptomyces nojiriensis]|nr:hypothetical protein JYK04_01697 [Streptomyces nojiriensis]